LRVGSADDGLDLISKNIVTSQIYGVSLRPRVAIPLHRGVTIGSRLTK
jgi:hypothetical protein